MALNEKQLKAYFSDHLSRIYCSKQHIASRFPELAAGAGFNDIRLAINETVEDVKSQLARMDNIYSRLNEEPRTGRCSGLKALLDEAGAAISEQKDDTTMRDMAILFYLQNIESTEIASFQVLRIIARALDDPQISQLLLENFDESREDRNLLLELTRKYLHGR